MANAEKGEIPYGDTGLYLHFSINSICELETRVKRRFTDVIKEIDAGEASFDMMRSLVWAGLLKCRPKINTAQVGNLMDEVGLQESITAVAEAVRAAYPSGEQDEAEKN